MCGNGGSVSGWGEIVKLNADCSISVERFKSESVYVPTPYNVTFLEVPTQAKIELHIHIKQNVECLLRSMEIVSLVFTVDSEISACIHFLGH